MDLERYSLQKASRKSSSKKTLEHIILLVGGMCLTVLKKDKA